MEEFENALEEILPYQTFWENTLRLNYNVERLSDALQEGINNTFDVYSKEESEKKGSAANTLTILHDSHETGSVFHMVDSTARGMEKGSLVKLHQAFAGNDEFADVMGQHGLGFYLLLNRLLGDRKEDGWTVISSDNESGNLYVASCTVGDIMAGKKPRFFMFSLRFRECEQREIYIRALAKHIGMDYTPTHEMEKNDYRNMMIDSHGTVIQVRTSRKFPSPLKDYYRNTVMPNLHRQIHVGKEARIQAIVDGETMVHQNSHFVRQDENLVATFTMKEGEWYCKVVEALGEKSSAEVTPEVTPKKSPDVSKPYTFKPYHGKQQSLTFTNHLESIANSTMPKTDIPDEAEFTITTSFRVGDMERAKSLLVHPYTMETFSDPMDLLNVEGIMIGIKTGTSTSFVGRVNPLSKGYYPAHRNFKNQFKGHPSSTTFESGKWDQLHLATVVMGAWGKHLMDIRPIKIMSTLSDERGPPLQAKKAFFNLVQCMCHRMTVLAPARPPAIPAPAKAARATKGTATEGASAGSFSSSGLRWSGRKRVSVLEKRRREEEEQMKKEMAKKKARKAKAAASKKKGRSSSSSVSMVKIERQLIDPTKDIKKKEKEVIDLTKDIKKKEKEAATYKKKYEDKSKEAVATLTELKEAHKEMARLQGIIDKLPREFPRRATV